MDTLYGCGFCIVIMLLHFWCSFIFITELLNIMKFLLFYFTDNSIHSVALYIISIKNFTYYFGF